MLSIYEKYTNIIKKQNEWIRVGKEIESGMNKYGKERLKLGLIVKNILNNLKVEWFIDNGTLLGAWRNSKFIEHDDDFDIGAYISNYNIKDKKWLKDKISKQLPDNYECRMIDEYAEKLEVYKKDSGTYILQGDIYNSSNYHHITVDIQFYLEDKINTDLVRMIHKINFHKTINKKDLFPLSKITLENEQFNSPYNSENVLTHIYGYLGKNCKYDSKLGLYVKNND